MSLPFEPTRFAEAFPSAPRQRREDPVIIAHNAKTRARSIRSVEGKAIAGTLLVKHLIGGEEMALIEIDIQSGVVAPIHAHAHESLLKRLATPEEIARSALHLACDASSFITGTAFLVDGGVSSSRA